MLQPSHPRRGPPAALPPARRETPKYEFVNEEGQTYYTDPVTKETSWEKPVSLQWTALVDAEGRTYYFNEATKFSQWDAPAALAWKQLEAQQQEPKSEL